MKKVLLTLLCVLLTVSFAGCGEKKDAVDTEKKEAGSASRERNAGDKEDKEDKEESAGSEEKEEDAEKEESGSEEK